MAKRDPKAALSQSVEIEVPATVAVELPADKPIEVPATVAIQIPVDGPVAEANFALHLDLRIPPELANALRRLAGSLDARQHRLRSGKRAVGPSDAVRFLIEEAAAALAKVS